MDQLTSLTEKIPEEVLIKKILEGEKRLFEHIMRRYNQRLYRIGMSILGSEMEAEDAMQNAYINAYEHLNKFEERASLGTWLTRIMLNECLAQKKKKQKFIMEPEMHPEYPVNGRTPASIMANKELGGVLENAVSLLPEKYRTVFVLREIEEMSVKETSQVLNIEEPNVKVRLNRAKTMLKESLHGYMKEQVYSFHLTRCNRMVATVFARLQI
jgi:RNA polymerase sigma factor (sigma-70 family)